MQTDLLRGEGTGVAGVIDNRLEHDVLPAGWRFVVVRLEIVGGDHYALGSEKDDAGAAIPLNHLHCMHACTRRRQQQF